MSKSKAKSPKTAEFDFPETEAPNCPKCKIAMDFARNRQDVIDEYACPKCGTTVNVRIDK